LARQLAEIAAKAERAKEEAKALEMQARQIHKEGWLFMRKRSTTINTEVAQNVSLDF